MVLESESSGKHDFGEVKSYPPSGGRRGCVMKRRTTPLTIGLAIAFALGQLAATAAARPPIKSDFFDVYPGADGTQLTDLPSNSKHCGVCHFDFDGGGRRNPYGIAVEALIQLGLSNEDAILAVQDRDSDGDGYTNLEEITLSLYNNVPSFPGLSAANLDWVQNVNGAEVVPYLTPSGSNDVTPPVVTLIYPNGGESFAAAGMGLATYSAADTSGIAFVRLFYSDDGGVQFKQLVDRAPDTGTISWFVPNLPGSQIVLRVEAVDNAGNTAYDENDSDFTVTAQAGLAPTTLRDVELPGTQPFEGAVLENPANHCVSCHGQYDPAIEPWETWKGSMMAQAMRDPLFLACLAVAEQDAPGVGDLCIRCHSPGGWQEGRSTDTGGGQITAKDRQGVQCDFCHRAVDPNYVLGVSPDQDVDALAAISPVPLNYANGQFITDPSPLPRGPFVEDTPTHQFVMSPFMQSSDLCGTCHDVSNPVYEKVGPNDYALTAFGIEHPTMDLRDMFPIERTYSEWSVSEYATTGVYAPQFAGTKPDGIVSTCQDCHMRDAAGVGCNQSGTPTRNDMPIHDLMGGNTFIPDILPDFYPGEVDPASLNAAKARAVTMLQMAASMVLTPTPTGVQVRVTNETGHKLPSGYPEGRRIWLSVEGKDTGNNVVFESGAYDFATGVLAHDPQIKVYEIQPGLSSDVAGAVGLPPGKSFHFVLNDTVYFDNRIPPRGATNAALDSIQSPVVDYVYADGQYWDDTHYTLPGNSATVTVTLYYQTTTKEYVEFLRDENTTNTAGQDLYDAWVAHGRAAPVVMAQETMALGLTGVEDPVPTVFAVRDAAPNPFAGRTSLVFETPRAGKVSVDVFDLQGRKVKTILDEARPAGVHREMWDGRNDRGRMAAAGVYFLRLRYEDELVTQRLLLVR